MIDESRYDYIGIVKNMDSWDHITLEYHPDIDRWIEYSFKDGFERTDMAFSDEDKLYMKMMYL
jgi:hypothetical protein